MTRVIIVEDESLAARKLARQLKNIDPDMEIVAVIDSVAGAVAFLSESTVDLIFLDIHLGDELSFNIFNKIKVRTPIIFTTAYDQYAIQAFKLNSIDYLLKPVNKSELKDALTKFYENRHAEPSIDYAALVQNLQAHAEPVFQSRFMVYKGDRVKSIDVENAAYFFAEGKHVYLVDREGSEHLIDYTLDRLLDRLDPQSFFRINRQFIIQICAIQEMVSYTKGRLKINLEPRPKKETIVSIERAMEFKNWLNR